jgi:hypothetical protein
MKLGLVAHALCLNYCSLVQEKPQEFRAGVKPAVACVKSQVEMRDAHHGQKRRPSMPLNGKKGFGRGSINRLPSNSNVLTWHPSNHQKPKKQSKHSFKRQHNSTLYPYCTQNSISKPYSSLLLRFLPIRHFRSLPSGLGMEPRASHVLGKSPMKELHPNLALFFTFLGEGPSFIPRPPFQLLTQEASPPGAPPPPPRAGGGAQKWPKQCMHIWIKKKKMRN